MNNFLRSILILIAMIIVFPSWSAQPPDEFARSVIAVGVVVEDMQSTGEYHTGILKKASFIFTRETISIDHLKKVGISGNHLAFVPAATFFLNIQDKEKADQFLKENGLEEKKFI